MMKRTDVEDFRTGGVTMIELNELSQFVAFAEYGTLSKAAEVLHLSQPALSRSMKKLEDELQIPLFNRTKNRLTLNENGQYVLELAKDVLASAASLTSRAREFDRRNRTISLGSCAPAPIWLLTPKLSSIYPSMAIQTQIAEIDELLRGLDDGTYQLIALPFAPEGEAYCSKCCGEEHLSFALPRGHRFARRKSLSFAEMNGENMLLMSDVGFWKSIHLKTMPDSKFLTQSDRFTFNELVEASTLPSFVTDLSHKFMETSDNRIEVPVSDPEGTATYYLVCRREQRRAYHALFTAL